MAAVQIKRGDTFYKQFKLWKNKTTNTPQALTGMTIRSQIRKGSTLVDTLKVTIVDELEGVFSVEESVSSENWPVATLLWDIEFTFANSHKKSTKTIEIECGKDITRNDI